jgi:PAS domain S-box-containing protein
MENDAIVITTVLSFIGGVCSWFWIKIVKPAKKFIDKNEDLADSVETIKTEITINGGGSLKDVVCKLGETCSRMEVTQKIIEQRTKASLHYNHSALFETDSLGRVVWSNEPFYDLTGQSLDDIKGYDWLTYVHEEERDECFAEFQSCLKMNRKFQRETKTCDNKEIRMLGFPYKLNEEEQGGFLVSVSELKKGE